MTESKALDNRQVIEKALIVLFGFLASGLLGFVRTAVLAGQFGTGAAFDSFTAAQRIPEIIFTLVAGGGLRLVIYPDLRQISPAVPPAGLAAGQRGDDLVGPGRRAAWSDGCLVCAAACPHRPSARPPGRRAAACYRDGAPDDADPLHLQHQRPGDGHFAVAWRVLAAGDCHQHESYRHHVWRAGDCAAAAGSSERRPGRKFERAGLGLWGGFERGSASGGAAAGAVQDEGEAVSPAVLACAGRDRCPPLDGPARAGAWRWCRSIF